MSYETLIALRYLRSKKRTGLISFTTFFSFTVIAFGVACITSILSIMNGFESVVLERFLAFDSHLQIIKKGEELFSDKQSVMQLLEKNQKITGYSPYVIFKAVLNSQSDRTITTVKGVDVKRVDTVSRFRKKVVYGSNDFSGNSLSSTPGIILSTEVADKLSVTVGNEVWVMGLQGLGRMFQQPPNRRFIVTGIFNAELTEYNNTYSFISIEAAQVFLRIGEDISGIDINTARIQDSPNVAQSLKAVLPKQLLVKTWYDLHKNLFSSMKLEKWAAFIVLSLMILIANFSITSALLMLILEKRKDIGILKSMGSSMNEIKNIFVTNGMIIGGTGTILGLTIGLTFCFLQIKYELIHLPSDIYVIDVFPVHINPLDFVIVGITALILTYLAALLPARSAGRLLTWRALHYE